MYFEIVVDYIFKGELSCRIFKTNISSDKKNLWKRCKYDPLIIVRVIIAEASCYPLSATIGLN